MATITLDRNARTLLRAVAVRDPVNLFRTIGTGGVTVPDPWQIESLRRKAKKEALLAARQTGKGEVLTAKGLNKAANKSNAQIGILTPSLRQSCRLLRRIRRALPATPHVTATNNATTSLTLSNGSEIVAWPGNRPDLIRGDTLDLLIIDEAAWVMDEAYTATLPMLAMANGDLCAASTPGGPGGFFFEIFNDEEKTEGWVKSRVTADDCPRYSEQTKAELRRALGESAYLVEMMCQWSDGADAIFTREELDRIFGVEPDPEDDDLPPEDYVPPPPRLRLATSFTDLLGAAS